MEADVGTLTTVLKTFLEVFSLGRAEVGTDARSLLSVLAAIEIALAGIAWLMTSDDAIFGLIKKLITVYFFVWLIDNYDRLLSVTVDGFLHVANRAAHNGIVDDQAFRDPSKIVDTGYRTVEYGLRALQNISLWSNPGDAIVTGFCILIILAAFYILAIQIFVTYLEFSLLTTLALIFLPFGVMRSTAFLAEKTFAAVIAFGVKLMVLGLIVAVAGPVLDNLRLPPDPNWTMLLNMVVTCTAIAALAWHAPGVAAGLLAGSPSLSASHAVSSAIPVGAAGATAAIGSAAGLGYAAKAGAYTAGRNRGNSTVRAANIAKASAGSSAGSGEGGSRGLGTAGASARGLGADSVGATAGSNQGRAEEGVGQQAKAAAGSERPMKAETAGENPVVAGVAAVATTAKQFVMEGGAALVRPITRAYRAGRDSAPGYQAFQASQETFNRFATGAKHAASPEQKKQTQKPSE